MAWMDDWPPEIPRSVFYLQEILETRLISAKKGAGELLSGTRKPDGSKAAGRSDKAEATMRNLQSTAWAK